MKEHFFLERKRKKISFLKLNPRPLQPILARPPIWTPPPLHPHPPFKQKTPCPLIKFFENQKWEQQHDYNTKHPFFKTYFVCKYSNYEKIKVNSISRISKYLVLFRRTILESFKISCKWFLFHWNKCLPFLSVTLQ